MLGMGGQNVMAGQNVMTSQQQTQYVTMSGMDRFKFLFHH